MSAKPEGVLLPVLRESTWPGSHQAICRPLVGGRGAPSVPLITFAFESPDSRATVTQASIDDLWLSPEQLQVEALRNLGKRSLSWEILARRPDGTPVALGCTDEFASEAVLLDGFLQQAQAILGAKALLVSMPNRGVLIVQDAYSGDPEEIQRLVSWTEQSYGTTNTPVSPTPLIVQNGALQGLVAPVHSGQTPEQAVGAAHQMPPAPRVPTEATPVDASPREHHYGFSHRVLPARVFRDPDETWSALHSARARVFVETLWESTGAHLPPSDRIAPHGMALSFSDVLGDGLLCAVLRLPIPRRVAEACAVCFVYRPSERRLLTRRPAQVRYYLLTCAAFRDDGCASAGLVELLEDGSRVPHGDVADTTEEAFLFAIAHLSFS